MKDMRQRADEVAEKLDGTAWALTDVATVADANNMEFCIALDALVLQCCSCGWWEKTDETKRDAFGEVVCTDCYEIES